MRVARLVHRWLVALLLPSGVRKRHGDDLRDTFEQALEDAHRRGEVSRLLWREAKDLLAARIGSMLHDHPGREASGRGTPRHRAGVSGTLRDDLTHALRSLRRAPGPVAFIVAIMAIAIGASTTIFSTARHTILDPLPYDDADRMVGLYRTVGDFGRLGPDAETFERWTAMPDVFDRAVASGNEQRTLTGRGDAVVWNMVLIGADYFDFLNVRPAVGRLFTEEEVARGDRVLLLGWEEWRTRFGGDSGIVGETVTLDGEPWTVIGVGPRDAPPPMSLVRGADAWAPLDRESVSTGVAVLAEGMKSERANERLAELVEAEHAANLLDARFGGIVERPGSLATQRLRSSLFTLGAAVALLLLIACMNVGSLLINRADRRRHETAVRVALGVGRGRLVRLHLLESVLLALLASAAGLGLAYWGTDLIRRLRPGGLDTLSRVTVDGPVLLFAVALSVGTGLLFGVMPALTAVSRRAVDALRSGMRSREDRAAVRARWGLVVAEVALSFALLVASGLLIRTVADLRAVDQGFRPEQLVAARLDLPEWRYSEDELPEIWRRVERELERLPSVRESALASGIPTRTGVYFGDLRVDGIPVGLEDEGPTLLFGSGVSAEYFEVLDQRIVEGRGFTPEEVRDEAKVYVLSETTARDLWPAGGAVGGRLGYGDEEPGIVVGVVADVNPSPEGDARTMRQMYTPARAVWDEGFLVFRVEGSVTDMLPEARRALRVVDENILVELLSLEDLLLDQIGSQRLTMHLLNVLATMALFLTTIGLFGVVAQVTGRRTREIGIRIALGAPRAGVAGLVLRSGLAATAAGIVAGSVLAWGAGRWIRAQVPGVDEADPATWIAAGLVLAMACLAATLLPAHRASRTDPVKAIASE
jgi:putative ABC transport system permease protein